jgi:N-acetylneuraminic acid mutarotase
VKKESKISGHILRGTVAALLLSGVTIGLSSAINITNHTPEASASEHNTAFGVNAHEGAASAEASAIQRNSTLTFADRVAYQRAIEEVYWRHRIWPSERPDPKPALDAVMSQAQLEKKVTNYLRTSEALGAYWQRPITAEQLQAEMDRMAQNTKQPEVLRELFEALGNDPLVIAECLARPVLAERLVRKLKNKEKVAAIDSIAEAVQVNRPYQLPAIAGASGGCIDDTWTATNTTDAPSEREYHTAVWTGTEMIVWGGFSFTLGDLNTGGRYNPSTDSWTATTTNNAPTARYGHTAIWTGTEMIVWGGSDSSTGFNTGAKYNPGTDTWSATSTTNAPDGRWFHTAVWADTEMIVWGGWDYPTLFDTGGRYNPTTDMWTATSTTNAPQARIEHTAVWTGSEMIVWGGTGDTTGGRYNPGTDSWTATSTANAPEPRGGHTAMWTGSEMIVWGGAGPSSDFNTGGRYNPDSDSWIATSTINAPSARHSHKAVWTDGQMIIWGGQESFYVLGSGGRYSPGTDAWTATSTANAPSGRTRHTAVWSGSEMIVWGGCITSEVCVGFTNTGGRYCAATGPTPTPTPSATPTATVTPTATPTPTVRPSPTPRAIPTPRTRPTPAPRP